ncbi:MAG: D-alanyl-D-alanine carboxypeptidase [Bacilli bacterium]|nr:D-alanyl-D-alanine carboxypeptidase [Bacilli bacterium]
MKKIFLSGILIIPILFLFNLNSVYAENLNIDSKYAIIYNMDTNEVLYEYNSNEITSIASLTKIMTCIVAIENIENLDTKVTLGKDVFYGLVEAQASVAGFKYGDNVSYRDLLMGAMLPSGADATRALAINIVGSEEAFVKLMNTKAKELNLSNTNFINTTGLEAMGHYSTVQDIATLLIYSLKNDTFKEIYTTREYTTTNNLKFSSTLKKISNGYTIDVSHIQGSKTGYTDEAGLCMSSIANYSDVNYLLITAGADYHGNTPRQLLDAIKIYSYFDENYSYKTLINANDYITTIKINYSKEKKYEINSPISITKFLDNSFDTSKIEYKYNGVNAISYNNVIGEKLGTVDIIYNNQLMDTIDIYLNSKINFSLISFLMQTKLIYPIIITILFISLLIIKKTFKKRRRVKFRH